MWAKAHPISTYGELESPSSSLSFYLCRQEKCYWQEKCYAINHQKMKHYAIQWGQ